MSLQLVMRSMPQRRKTLRRLALSSETLEVRLLLAADVVCDSGIDDDKPCEVRNPSLGFALAQELDVLNSSDVDFGDFSGDGVDELFFTMADGLDEVWTRRSRFEPVVHGPSRTLTEHRGVYSALGDINRDGTTDVVTAGASGQPTRLLLNRWNSHFDSVDIAGLDASLETIDVALGDLNGDGWIDLFVANAGQAPNLVFFNSQFDGFYDSGQVLGEGNSKSVELSDIDGDGDVDAVVANVATEFSDSATMGAGSTVVWLNDGSGVFELGSTLVPGGEHVAVGDLNGDGHPDLAGAQDGPNHVWFNDGTGSFTDSQLRIGDELTSQIVLGDVDNDDDLDILAANWIGDPNTLWLNHGGGDFYDSGLRLDADLRSEHMALGDVDIDGDLDLVVANRRDPNRIYLNTLQPSDINQNLNRVSELATVGTVVGVTAFASGNVSYSLSDDAEGRFAIDSETGVVTVAGRLDYESQREHRIDVEARTSSAVLTNSFEIHVRNEAEPTVEVNVIDIDFESPFRQQLRVKYLPVIGRLDRSTIGDDDIEVVAPDGTVFTPVYTGHGNFSSGRFFDANYSMVAPGGFWDAQDNGTYEVRMRLEEIADDRGAWIQSGVITTFEVNIHDGHVPTAEVSAEDIIEPTTGMHAVTVTLKVDSSIALDPLEEPAPFTLLRPDGSSVAPLLMDVQSSAGDREFTLTYNVWPSGDSRGNAVWNEGDNGVYNIVATEARVRDSNGLLLRGGIVGSFTVDIAADQVGPKARLKVESLQQASDSAYRIQVEYQDDSGVDVDSIGDGDISVVTSNGWTVQPTFESLSFPGGAVVATYTLAGSTGNWDAADNGSYQVFLNSDEVEDGRGNTSPSQLLGAFEVDIRSQLPGDLNRDGQTDFADFLILSFHFGSDDASADDGDLDGDGRVNFSDFLLFTATLN